VIRLSVLQVIKRDRECGRHKDISRTAILYTAYRTQIDRVSNPVLLIANTLKKTCLSAECVILDWMFLPKLTNIKLPQ